MKICIYKCKYSIVQQSMFLKNTQCDLLCHGTAYLVPFELYQPKFSRIVSNLKGSNPTKVGNNTMHVMFLKVNENSAIAYFMLVNGLPGVYYIPRSFTIYSY